MFLSIVIPVYRSQDVLAILVEQIHIAVTTALPEISWELILINDGSPDKSWATICELAESHSFVKGISLRRNFGQHNALMAGLNHATGDIIIMMDDDLQHPPTAIPKLINAMTHEYDVCYTHYNNRRHQLWKKIGSRFNDKMAVLIFDKPQGLYLSSFKVLRKEVAKEIIKYDGPYPYVDGLILNVTRSITSIEIEHQASMNRNGTSCNIRSSILLWLRMVTGFSVLPLRFASFVGLTISALSLIMVFVVIMQKITNPNIAVGWTSLIAVSLFVGGIQLLCTGMMGEYIARTYLKINNSPQFVIGHQTPEGE